MSAATDYPNLTAAAAINTSNLFDMQQKMAEVWPLHRVAQYLTALPSR